MFQKHQNWKWGGVSEGVGGVVSVWFWLMKCKHIMCMICAPHVIKGDTVTLPVYFFKCKSLYNHVNKDYLLRS